VPRVWISILADGDLTNWASVLPRETQLDAVHMGYGHIWPPHLFICFKFFLQNNNIPSLPGKAKILSTTELKLCEI
jgi:hypothetical protein